MYAKLKGAKVFSTIDLRSGYHHIALGKDSRAKTAFVTPFGKYKFLMVPFGLAQAPAYFQLLMNKVLEGLPYAMTYLDDIIIFSKNEEEHLGHLEYSIMILIMVMHLFTNTNIQPCYNKSYKIPIGVYMIQSQSNVIKYPLTWTLRPCLTQCIFLVTPT